MAFPAGCIVDFPLGSNSTHPGVVVSPQSINQFGLGFAVCLTDRLYTPKNRPPRPKILHASHGLPRHTAGLPKESLALGFHVQNLRELEHPVPRRDTIDDPVPAKDLREIRMKIWEVLCHYNPDPGSTPTSDSRLQTGALVTLTEEPSAIYVLSSGELWLRRLGQTERPIELFHYLHVVRATPAREAEHLSSPILPRWKDGETGIEFVLRPDTLRTVEADRVQRSAGLAPGPVVVDLNAALAQLLGWERDWVESHDGSWRAAPTGSVRRFLNDATPAQIAMAFFEYSEKVSGLASRTLTAEQLTRLFELEAEIEYRDRLTDAAVELSVEASDGGTSVATVRGEVGRGGVARGPTQGTPANTTDTRPAYWRCSAGHEVVMTLNAAIPHPVVSIRELNHPADAPACRICVSTSPTEEEWSDECVTEIPLEHALMVETWQPDRRTSAVRISSRSSDGRTSANPA